jgi:hypothetical protein
MPVFRTVKDARSGSIRLEAIHQPLYDSVSLTTTLQTSATLFSLGNNGRSALYTNLQTAGQLSWPKRFSIRALRQVLGFNSATYANVAVFWSSAFYQLQVGEKVYLTIPSFILTAGGGLSQQTLVPATATTAGTINCETGWPDQRNIYSLLHSIYLPPVQNFFLAMTTAGGTLSAATYVHIFLEGELLREIQ